MNRVKQFKMSPETAYRFAIGEYQIETKERLESKFSEDVRAFFVLNADQPLRNFVPNHWSNHDTKLSEYGYVDKYYKIMAGTDLLSEARTSAEFTCNSIYESYLCLQDPARRRHGWDKSGWYVPNNLTEEETEIFIKSPKWAVKYAKKIKRRFAPSIEKRFIEGKEISTHAKENGRAYILEYCKIFNIILDNYNEILLQEGFGERSNRRESDANKAYLKKIQEEKENCKLFLSKIIETNGLDEKDSIKKLMECLC